MHPPTYGPEKDACYSSHGGDQIGRSNFVAVEQQPHQREGICEGIEDEEEN